MNTAKPSDYVIFPPGLTEEQKAEFRRHADEWDKRYLDSILVWASEQDDHVSPDGPIGEQEPK